MDISKNNIETHFKGIAVARNSPNRERWSGRLARPDAMKIHLRVMGINLLIVVVKD